MNSRNSFWFWFVLFGGLLMVMLVSPFSRGCKNEKVKGNGNLETVSRSVAGFNEIFLAGSIDLKVRQGEKFDVKIHADENLLKHINLDKKGSQLVIKMQKGIRYSSANPIVISIVMPRLTKVSSAGSGDIEIENQFVSDNKLELSVAGSGNVKGSIHSPDVVASIAGSGDMTLQGECRNLDVNILGSGNFRAADLKSENADLNIAGSGDIQVFVSQELKANIAGSGNIRYAGNPLKVERNVAGSGAVNPAD